MRRSPQRATKRRPTVDWVHQFLIVLTSTDPLVWRRIQVPESYSFWDLHVAIQDAMGWLDCHLHEFRIVTDLTAGRVERFGIPVDEFLEQPPVRPDWTVRVSSVVGKGDLPMRYVYDFGDGWQHIVMYEGGAQLDRRVRYPHCVSGSRKCPPEDCGGPRGYAELKPSAIPITNDTQSFSTGSAASSIRIASTRRRSPSTIQRSGGRLPLRIHVSDRAEHRVECHIECHRNGKIGKGTQTDASAGRNWKTLNC